jgi:hypothetical protein
VSAFIYILPTSMILSQGQLDRSNHGYTIRAFLEGQSAVNSGFSTAALRVKASALFECADRLSTSWDFRKPCKSWSILSPLTTRRLGSTASNNFRDDFQKLDRLISRFIATLLPVHQLDATMPRDKHSLIVIHSLANAAMIHLCYRFSREDTVSYEKSLRAARTCVSIIKQISSTDFDFLDPIIGVLHLFMCSLRMMLTIDASFSRAGLAPRRSSYASCATGKPRGP